MRCTLPMKPKNGFFYGDGTSIKSKIKFRCFDGYKMRSNLYNSKEDIQEAEIECGEFGLWKGIENIYDCSRKFISYFNL